MTKINGRLFAHLRKIVVAGLLLTLVAGILLPVYTDEIGWRLQERAWLDGVDKLYSDNCGPNTLATPPFYMWPVRWYSAFFNTHFPDPLFVRISGVAYAIAFIWLVLRLVGRIGRSGEERDVLAIIASALMGLGVMPLLLVWSRPEQPIFLAAAGAVLIASAGWRSPGNRFAPFNGIAYSPALASPGTAWARSLMILALALVALSYHFKAVLLLPAFIACISFASRGRAALMPRIAAIVLLVAAGASGGQYWVKRMECPMDPIVARQHARQNLVGQLKAGTLDKGQLALKILGNYKLQTYAEHAAPAVVPMSAWLPVNQIDKDAMKGWRAGLTIIWGVSLAFAIISFISGSIAMLREKILPPEPVIALTLLGAVSAWCVSQTDRYHVYEASFVLPLLMLAIILALASPHRWAGLRQYLGAMALALAPLTLLSIVLVAKIYGPVLLYDSRQRNFLPHHPWSVPVFGYHDSYAQIMGAARQCHIPFPKQAQHLLIDDVTYFAFMQSRLPDHELAVMVKQFRGSIDDPIAYLKAHNSSGIIMRCRKMLPEYREKAQRNGDFCCLAPPDWDQAPKAK